MKRLCERKKANQMHKKAKFVYFMACVVLGILTPLAWADCVTRTADELNKGTFAICAMCHGRGGSPVPWLVGDAHQVWGQMERILKNGPLPYTSPQKNSLVGKPKADSGLAHGGGKMFPTETIQPIEQFVADLEAQGCVSPQAGQSGENPSPLPSGAPTLHMFQFVQLETFFTRLTGQRFGRTLQLIQTYKNQLGFRETRTQIDSRVPLSPMSAALLDRLLAWGCAEAVDVRGWADMDASAFSVAMGDFLNAYYGFTDAHLSQIITALQVKEQQLLSRTSLRAARVAQCYLVLRTERFWLR